jgi:hypothetical protein
MNPGGLVNEMEDSTEATHADLFDHFEVVRVGGVVEARWISGHRKVPICSQKAERIMGRTTTERSGVGDDGKGKGSGRRYRKVKWKRIRKIGEKRPVVRERMDRWSEAT